jgi:hypothetical protein
MQADIPQNVLAEVVQNFALQLFLDHWPKDTPFEHIVEEVRTNARSVSLGELAIAAPVIAQFIEKAQKDATALLQELDRLRQRYEPDIEYTAELRSLTTGGSGSAKFKVLDDETVATAAQRTAKNLGAYVVKVVAEFPFSRPG